MFTYRAEEGKEMEKEKEKSMTQKERVLTYLQNNGKMTNWDAIRLFGLTCLQVTIKELRKEHEIETIMVDSKNRFGEPTRHGVYVYKGMLK